MLTAQPLAPSLTRDALTDRFKPCKYNEQGQFPFDADMRNSLPRTKTTPAVRGSVIYSVESSCSAAQAIDLNGVSARLSQSRRAQCDLVGLCTSLRQFCCAVKTCTMEEKSATMSMKIPRQIVQRVCIWFSLRLGRTPSQTLTEMQAVFGNTSYKKSAVYKWHAAFSSRRTKLGDLLRPGAPQRARTRRRIRQCKVIIDNDRHVKVDQISRTLGISHGSTLRILHKDLGLQKRAAKLVPQQLTEEHMRKRRRFCEDFIRRSRLQRHFLNSVMTTDEAWFYVIETRTKQENK